MKIRNLGGATGYVETPGGTYLDKVQQNKEVASLYSNIQEHQGNKRRIRMVEPIRVG